MKWDSHCLVVSFDSRTNIVTSKLKGKIIIIIIIIVGEKDWWLSQGLPHPHGRINMDQMEMRGARRM